MPDQEPIEGLGQEIVDVFEKVSIPFPTKTTVYTFALTDPAAPDGISLRFDAPLPETVHGWEKETTAKIVSRMSGAVETARGIGGEAAPMAIALQYQNAIQRQADIEAKLQRLLNEAVKIRGEMEILRQMASAK